MFNNWNAAKHKYKSQKLLEMFSKWNTKQKQAEESKAKLNQALNIKKKKEKDQRRKQKEDLWRGRETAGHGVKQVGQQLNLALACAWQQRNTAGAETEEVQVKVGWLPASPAMADAIFELVNFRLT